MFLENIFSKINMYGVKQLQFDSSEPNPACDACSNKHLSLFSLGDYCKVYDNKSCCFSELAKAQIQLCKDCIYALRKTKVFQARVSNAQRNMEAQLTIIPNFQGQRIQRTLHQLLYDDPAPIINIPTDPTQFRAFLSASLLRSC